MRIESVYNNTPASAQAARNQDIPVSFRAFMAAQMATQEDNVRSRKQKAEEENLRAMLTQIKLMPDGREKQRLMEELRSAIGGVEHLSPEVAEIIEELESMENAMDGAGAGPYTPPMV